MATSPKAVSLLTAVSLQNCTNELKVGTGLEYVCYRFREELRANYRRQERMQYVKLLGDFMPKRMKCWMQDHFIQFRKEYPEIKQFKLHSFGATAISQVRQAGVSVEKAFIYHYAGLRRVRWTPARTGGCAGCGGFYRW